MKPVYANTRKREMSCQKRADDSLAQHLETSVFASGWLRTLQEKEKHSWKVQDWAVLLLGAVSGPGTHSPHFDSHVAPKSFGNYPP